MEMWVLWPVVTFLLCSYLGGANSGIASSFHVAFRMCGSTVGSVNGLYICISDAKCTRLSTHRWGPTTGDSEDKYSMTSSSVLVGNQVQKRWYISRRVQSGEVANLFGAIELSALPDFSLKTWKRLGENGAFEPNMTTITLATSGNAPRISTGSQGTVEADEGMVLRLLESANALLFLVEDPTFDASSERGRHITQTLYEHAQALEAQSLGRHDGEVALQRAAFQCDFAAVTGRVTWASICYAEVTTQLQSHLQSLRTDRDPTTAVVPSMLWIADAALSPLQCSTAGDDAHLGQIEQRVRCHLYTLQLRQARHWLLHALQPAPALVILQDLQDRVAAPFTGPWMALARCLLGDCAATGLANSAVRVACEDLLARLAGSKDSTFVHTLYSQICVAMQSAATNHGGRTQRSFDHSRSIVASLLSVGATQVAAAHIACQLRLHGLTAETPCQTPTSGREYRDMYDALALRQPSLALLIRADPSGSVPNLASVLSSTNVQAALTLHSLLSTVLDDASTRERFLADGDLLSVYLGTVLQATAPVTLQSASDGLRHTVNASAPSVSMPWAQEAVLLRYLLVDTLQALVYACKDLGVGRCAISDPVSNVGARGLFLLAYQGLGLLGDTLLAAEAALVPDSTTADASGYTERLRTVRWVLNDATVSALYEELVQLASPPVGDLLLKPPHEPDRTGLAVGTTEQSSLTTATTAVGEAARPQKIRVGFLSFFLRKHPVGRLLGPIIAGLDHDVFDVFVITSNTAQPDEITAYLQAHVGTDKWVYITHSLSDAVASVRRLALDTLVYGDIFMDSFVAHLAMHRLATVQVAFWGHPFTSGYEAVDYFVTSDLFETPSAQSRHGQFLEQLVRFDSLSFRLYESSASIATSVDGPGGSGLPAFQPRLVTTALDMCRSASKHSDEHSDPVARNAFSVQRRRVLEWITSVGYTIEDSPLDVPELLTALYETAAGVGNSSDATANDSLCAQLDAMVDRAHLYGALQSLFKLHPLFDTAVVSILAADPRAVIIISRNGKQRIWEEHYRQRLQRAVTGHWARLCQQNTADSASYGCDGSGVRSALARVLFVNQMQHAAYAALLCAMDVTLDTFPFGGGVTLSDALYGCAKTVVPFVTAGQLQSVHQIGHGMALRLNDSAIAHAVMHSTRRPAPLALPTEPAALLWNELSAVVTRWSDSTARYVAEAVETAARSQERKLSAGVGQQQSRGKSGGYDEQRQKIRLELFQANDSVQEWSAFLQLIVQTAEG